MPQATNMPVPLSPYGVLFNRVKGITSQPTIDFPSVPVTTKTVTQHTLAALYFMRAGSAEEALDHWFYVIPSIKLKVNLTERT